MTKLTNKQKEKIRNLSEQGKKQKEIAEILGVSQRTISYWLLPEDKRKEDIKKISNNFKSKSIKEKRKIYKTRLEYLKKYQRDRYNSDKEFRKKKLESSKKNYIKRNKNGK